MRGMKILGVILIITSLVLGYLVWPSSAIIDRKISDLQRGLGETESVLSDIGESVREIAKQKPANRLKKSFEELKRSVSLIRHRLGRLEDDPDRGGAASLDLAAELRTAIEIQFGNATDLRARTTELLAAMGELTPLVAEANRLRALLQNRVDQLVKSDGELSEIQELREAIQASSNHESLVKQSFEKFSQSIAEGRILAGTAKNELGTVLARMRQLAEKP